MRWNDIHVGAVATSLGRTESTATAVAEGRYDPEEKEASGYLSTRVSDHGSPVDLAVDAVNLVLQRSGHRGEDFELLLHASVAFQGLDDFAAASYIQSRTIAGRAVSMEIKQASNGSMAAIELAASYLAARPGTGAALVTTADRFVPPVFDRFGTAGGLLLGDGGTAMVLTREAGVARLLSSASLGDATYQGLQVGQESWTQSPGERGWPVDGQARIEGFIAEHGPEVFPEMVQSIWSNENEVMSRALDDAGLQISDVDWWVFPNMGESLTDWDSRKSFGVELSRATWWDWGRRQGHLGAGDPVAGLTYLLESGKAKVGDRIMLNSAGTGFSFSAALVQVTAQPQWSNSADN